MRKLCILLTLLSTLFLSVPVMAATQPSDYATPSRVTFQVTAETEDSDYISFEWHCIDPAIDKEGGWVHRYDTTNGRGKWSITDTFLAPEISVTTKFYCIIHDEHGDLRSKTFRTDDVDACLIYNLDTLQEANVGQVKSFQYNSTPRTLSDELNQGLQWFKKTAGSSAFTEVKNANDWVYTTPKLTKSNDQDTYFLRTKTSGLAKTDPSVYVDTQPITITVNTPGRESDIIVPIQPPPAGIPDGTPISSLEASYINETGTPQYEKFVSSDFKVLIKYKGYPSNVYEATVFEFKPKNANKIGDNTVTIYVNDGKSTKETTCIAKGIRNPNLIYPDTPDYPDPLDEPIVDARASYIGSGNYQYEKWDKSGFKVEVKYESSSDTWTAIDKFSISPENSDTLGINTVTVYINDGVNIYTRSVDALCIKNPNRMDPDPDDPTPLPKDVSELKAEYTGTGNPQYLSWNKDDFNVEVKYKNEDTWTHITNEYFYVKPVNSDILGNNTVTIVVKDPTGLKSTTCIAKCIENPDLDNPDNPIPPAVNPTPPGIPEGTKITQINASYKNTDIKQYTAFKNSDFTVKAKYEGYTDWYDVQVFSHSPRNATTLGNITVTIYVNDGTTVHTTNCIVKCVENPNRYNGPIPQEDPNTLPKVITDIKAEYIGTGNKQFLKWNKDDFKVEVQYMDESTFTQITDFNIDPPNSDYLGTQVVTITVKDPDSLKTTTCTALCIKNPDYDYGGDPTQPDVNPTPSDVPAGTSVSSIKATYVNETGTPQYEAYKQTDFSVQVKYEGYDSWYDATIFTVDPTYPTVIGQSRVTIYLNDGNSIKSTTCIAKCIENPDRYNGPIPQDDPESLDRAVTSVRASYTGSGNYQYLSWNKADFKVEVEYTDDLGNWDTVTKFNIDPPNSDYIGSTEVTITVNDGTELKTTTCTALCIANPDLPEIIDPTKPPVSPTPSGIPAGTGINVVKVEYTNPQGTYQYTKFNQNDFSVKAKYKGYNDWYDVPLFTYTPKSAMTLGKIEVNVYVNDGSKIHNAKCYAKCIKNPNRTDDSYPPIPESLDRPVKSINATYTGSGNYQYLSWNKADFRVEVEYEDDTGNYYEIDKFAIDPPNSDVIGDSIPVEIIVNDGSTIHRKSIIAKCIANPSRYDDSDLPESLDRPVTEVRATYTGNGNYQYTAWNKSKFKVEVKYTDDPDNWETITKFNIDPPNAMYLGNPIVTVVVYDGTDVHRVSCEAKCIKNPNHVYEDDSMNPAVNPTPDGIPDGTPIVKVKAEYINPIGTYQYTKFYQSDYSVKVKYNGYDNWYDATIFSFTPINALTIGKISTTVYVNDGTTIHKANCKSICIANPKRYDGPIPQEDPESLGKPVTNVRAEYTGSGNPQYEAWHKEDFKVEVVFEDNPGVWEEVNFFNIDPPNSDFLGTQTLTITVNDGEQLHTCTVEAICVENPDFNYNPDPTEPKPPVNPTPSGIPEGTPITDVVANYINTTGTLQYTAFQKSDFSVKVKYSGYDSWYDASIYTYRPLNAEVIGSIPVTIYVNDGTTVHKAVCTAKCIANPGRYNGPIPQADPESLDRPATSIRATYIGTGNYQFLKWNKDDFIVEAEFTDQLGSWEQITLFNIDPPNSDDLGEQTVTIIANDGDKLLTCQTEALCIRNPYYKYGDNDEYDDEVIDDSLPNKEFDTLSANCIVDGIEQYTAYSKDQFKVTATFKGDDKVYDVYNFSIRPLNVQEVGRNHVSIIVRNNSYRKTTSCIVNGIRNPDHDYGDDKTITDKDGHPLPSEYVQSITAVYTGNPVAQYEAINPEDVTVVLRFVGVNKSYVLSKDSFKLTPKNIDFIGDNEITVTVNTEFETATTTVIVPGVANAGRDYDESDTTDYSDLAEGPVESVTVVYNGDGVPQYTRIPKENLVVSVKLIGNDATFLLDDFNYHPHNADLLGDNIVSVDVRGVVGQCVVPGIANPNRNYDDGIDNISDTDIDPSLPNECLESISAEYIGNPVKQFTAYNPNDFRVKAKFINDPVEYEVNSFILTPSNATVLGRHLVYITVKTAYNIGKTYTEVECIENPTRNYNGPKEDDIITETDANGETLPNTSITSLTATYLGDPVYQYTAINKSNINVIATFDGSDKTYKISDFSVKPVNMDYLGTQNVLVTVRTNNSSAFDYCEVEVIRNPDYNYKDDETHTDIDGNPLPTTAITSVRAVYVGTGTEQYTAYRKEDFEVYVKFENDGQNYYRVDKFSINPKNAENIGDNVVTITVNGYDCVCVALGIKYSKHNYPISQVVSFSQNHGVTLFDGTLIKPNNVKALFEFSDGSTTIVYPGFNSINFIPSRATVGYRNYDLTFDYDGVNYTGNVELFATMPYTETDGLPDAKMVGIEAKYIGTGTPVNTKYSREDFEVKVWFENYKDPYTITNFSLTPSTPKKIGDNAVRVIVYHGMDIITTVCTATGIENHDTNNNGIQDDSIVKIKLSYDDTEITEGNSFEVDKAHVVSVTDLGVETPISNEDVEYSDVAGQYTYNLTAKYMDLADTVTLTVRGATISDIEVSYTGTGVVGVPIDEEYLTVLLVFDNGAKEQTKSYTIDDYTLLEGPNELSVTSSGFTKTFTVNAVSLANVTVNSPEIKFSSVKEYQSLNANAKSGLKLFGITAEALQTATNAVVTTITDKLTSNGNHTNIMYSIDNGEYMQYQSPVTTTVTDMIAVAAYSNYAYKQSDITYAYAYLDDNGNPITTYPKSLYIIYTGDEIAPGGSFDAKDLEVYLTFEGTDATRRIDGDFTVDNYDIKEGNNKITVHYRNYTGTVNIPGTVLEKAFDTQLDKSIMAINAEAVTTTAPAGTQVTKDMFTVKAKYSDATEQILTDYNFDVNEIKLGNNYIKITYGGFADDVLIYGTESTTSEYNEKNVNTEVAAPVLDKKVAMSTRIDKSSDSPIISVGELTDTVYDALTDGGPTSENTYGDGVTPVKLINEGALKRMPIVKEVSDWFKVTPLIALAFLLLLAAFLIAIIIGIILYKRGRLDMFVQAIADKKSMRFKTIHFDGTSLRFMLVNAGNASDIKVQYRLIGNEEKDSRIVDEVYAKDPEKSSIFISSLFDTDRLEAIQVIASTPDGLTAASDIINLTD